MRRSEVTIEIPSPAQWNLRLYVAGQTPKSLEAFANLKRICDEHLPGLYNIEVVDLRKNPQLAMGDQILALPTLVRKLPEPVRKIVGDLSNTQRVLVGLDLRPRVVTEALLKRRMGIDDTKAFERALSSPLPAKHYRLRLFVTGSTPRSARAIQNIRAICEDRLRGRYELEVVDIYQHPEQANPEQIVVAPTLVKKLPSPVRKIIGDLSDEKSVLAGLDLTPREPLRPLAKN